MFGADFRHGLGQRFFDRRRASVVLPQGAGAMALLCQVDQLEIAGEGTRDLLGSVQAPRCDDSRCVALVLIAVACGDHRPAQQLDVLEQTGPAVLRQYLPQHVAQQAHLSTQRSGHVHACGLA